MFKTFTTLAFIILITAPVAHAPVAHAAGTPALSETPKGNIVGTIVAVEGITTINTPGQKARAARANTQVYVQDQMATGPRARMLVRMLDDTRITLGASTTLLVDDFTWPGEEGRNRATYTVGKGSVDMKAGAMLDAEDHRITLNIPYGSIDMRGPSIWAGLLDGDYAVLSHDGSFIVDTSVGRARLASGQGTFLRDKGQPPGPVSTWSEERTTAIAATVNLKSPAYAEKRATEIAKGDDALLQNHRAILTRDTAVKAAESPAKPAPAKTEPREPDAKAEPKAEPAKSNTALKADSTKTESAEPAKPAAPQPAPSQSAPIATAPASPAPVAPSAPEKPASAPVTATPQTATIVTPAPETPTPTPETAATETPAAAEETPAAIMPAPPVPMAKPQSSRAAAKPVQAEAPKLAAPAAVTEPAKPKAPEKESVTPAPMAAPVTAPITSPIPVQAEDKTPALKIAPLRATGTASPLTGTVRAENGGNAVRAAPMGSGRTGATGFTVTRSLPEEGSTVRATRAPQARAPVLNADEQAMEKAQEQPEQATE